MAYKRHSQGGSFKKSNFGDLGLRAYKDQQDQQIRALKEQNREQKEISRGNLQEMRGSAAAEIEHNRQLQNFYNKRDKLAIQNTEFRGKTEYDKLMGEAKELEKKGEFWKNFSETYSQQFVKAAGGIYDAAMVVQSNHQLDRIYGDPKFHKFEANNSVLNNISSDEQVKEAFRILSDPKATKDQINNYLGHIVDLGFRMNHKTKLALINRELADWPREHIRLRSLATENGLKWNAETIGQFYYLRARELMRAYDVDPSSKAGRALLKGIQDKQAEEVAKLTGISKANADTVRAEELNETITDLVGPIKIAVQPHTKYDKAKGKGEVSVVNGTNSIEYNNTLNTAIAHEGGRYRLTEQGVVVEPTGGNTHGDAASLFERLIKSGTFKSKEQAKRHTIMQLTPNAKKQFLEDGDSMSYLTKDTWLGRHPSLGDKFDDWWKEYETEQRIEFKEEKDNEDFTNLTSIKDRALRSMTGEIQPTLADGTPNKEYINLSDRSTVTQLLASNTKNENTTAFLSNFQVYNQYNLNGDLVTADLTTKFKEGKLNELKAHLSFLPPNIQNDWRDKLEQLEILKSKGYLDVGLTQNAQGILIGILDKDGAIKREQLSGDHFRAVTGYIKQDILATFDQVSEKLGPDASAEDKIDAMRVEIQRKIDANEGVYRRITTGENALSTKFLIDPTIKEQGNENIATDQEIEDSFKEGVGSIAYDNLMNEIFNTGNILVNGVPKRLISINDADTAVRDINLGLAPPFNKTIDFIFKNQPMNHTGTKYTRRQIWNEYFKGVGINTQIKPGSIDFALHKVDASPMNVPVNLSEENTESVGVVVELVNDNVIDITQPSKESIKVNEEKQVRQNVFQNFWNWIPEDQKRALIGDHYVNN